VSRNTTAARPVLPIVGWTAAALATVALFLVSRGKWSDAIVDSGREWIVPDALSRGELLYRDVVYWFGPFTPYFHALFFRIFGSSFSTLVLAGCVGAAGVLVSLFFALRQVTDSRSAAVWTVLAVPALVFMPDAGGAILGMGYRMWHAAGFALLAVTLAVWGPRAPVSWRVVGAGAAAGLAGLCRTEWGIAALLAAGLAAGLRLRSVRLAAVAWLAIGFLIVFLGGLGIFLMVAGPRPVLQDAPVLLFNLPSETLDRFRGGEPSAWIPGVLQMLYGAATLVAAFLAIEIVAAHRTKEDLRSRLLRLGVLLLLIVGCVALGEIPHSLFSGAPLLCAASALAGWEARRQPLGAALVGYGALGVLTSHRRVFFLTDGPYVAPPLLFAFVCAAGCATLVLSRRDSLLQEIASSLLAGTIAALVAVAFFGRGVGYLGDERKPVPGTSGMLSAPRETVDAVRRVVDALRTCSPSDGGLAVFPEGEVLNYLSGRRNPIRYKLYLPGYLQSQNESRIIEELSHSPPGSIVIWPRPLGEYGRGFFGDDFATRLRAWIAARYRPVPVKGAAGHAPAVLCRNPEVPVSSESVNMSLLVPSTW
jgi:hypothetical protein